MLYPASFVGLRMLGWLRQSWPGIDFIAHGGIGGDAIGQWLAAGARGVALEGALYSEELLAARDSVSVRNFAAAAHQEATRYAVGSGAEGAVSSNRRDLDLVVLGAPVVALRADEPLSEATQFRRTEDGRAVLTAMAAGSTGTRRRAADPRG